MFFELLSGGWGALGGINGIGRGGTFSECSSLMGCDGQNVSCRKDLTDLTMGHESRGQLFMTEHLGLSHAQEAPQTSWFPLATWHPVLLHSDPSAAATARLPSNVQPLSLDTVLKMAEYCST